MTYIDVVRLHECYNLNGNVFVRFYGIVCFIFLGKLLFN